MNKDLRIAASWLLRYAGLGALVAVPALLFRLDTLWLGNSVGEWSLVELAAEGMLPRADARLNTETPGSAIDRLVARTCRAGRRSVVASSRWTCCSRRSRSWRSC